MTTRHAIAAAAALFAFDGLGSGPAAQTTCNAPLGWWESQGLEPVFSNPAPDGATDCDFQVWSWTAFVHWMQNDPATGEPLFLNLPTPADLQAGNVAAAEPAPRTLALSPRFQKPKAMGEIEQASGGILVDQDGRVVYYATHMEPTYFSFTQQYYGPENYQNAAPTLEYPVGATVFKTAWRIVPEGETVSGAYTTTATIDLLESDREGGLQPSGEMQDGVTVELVGVHVVGVVEDHPEFLWATFEQVDNVPDLPAGMAPNSPDPVSSESFTFYAAGTPAEDSNETSPLSIDAATQVVSPVINAFRQYAYGGAAPERVTDIEQSNANFQQAIAEPANPAIDTVFANYRLNGTVWILAGTLQPGDGNIDYEAIGSVNLASSVMETFVQNMIPGGPGNCFTCHNTSGQGSYPGKNINFSHIILNSLD